MKKTSFLFTTIVSIVIFCCLQSTIFADDDFIPAIPKYTGCKAKCVNPNTQKRQGQQGQQNPKHKAQSTNTPALQHSTNFTNPSSIIALSPAIAEIVYAIGGGDSIIAVSDFCNYPAGAKKKPKIGGYINPSYERILLLEPDLLIFQGKMAKINSFCEKYKIKSLNVKIDNWVSITNSIQRIGNVLGKEVAAKNLRRNMAVRWNKLKNSKLKRTVPVFICAGREPGPVASSMIPGKKSFINEALEIAGGSNICSDVIGAYPTVSSEVIFARQPEIIFELRPGERIAEKKLRKEWNFLKGNKRKIIFITNDFAMVPGPRIVDLAELFRRKLK